MNLDRDQLLQRLEDTRQRLAAAEQALADCREENAVLFELAGVGRGEVEAATGRFLRVNKAYCQIVGYTAEEVLQKTIRDITHPDDTEIFYKASPRLLSGEIESHAEVKRYIHKDGRIIWVSIHSSLIRGKGGRPDIMTGVIEDITAQKLAEMAAEENAAKFRGVFENSFDAIAVCKDAFHIMANAAYLRLFGYSSMADLCSIPSAHLVAPSVRASIEDRLRRRNRGEPVPTEYITRGIRKDGTEFDLEVHISLFPIGGESFHLIVVRDVTERLRAQEFQKKAHEDLELAVAERTADLSRANARLQRESAKRKRLELAMWDAVDREQRRIGQDLHDSLGQQLVGISFTVKALRAPHDPAITAGLERVARLLCDAIGQTREIAHGLYPPELEDGLFHALGYLSQEVTLSYGIACHFEVGETFSVKEGNARQLYRVAQEAIANSLKHGRAKRIDIELARIRGSARLTIRDNGAGFPAHSVRPGMGLKTMRNRARLLGGRLLIKRNPAGGTIVTCSYREKS
jgi:PAS domain S-box-containing protein